MLSCLIKKAALKLSNEMLDEQVAQFESDQLIQQISGLEQRKVLQQLELTKGQQATSIHSIRSCLFIDGLIF